MGYCVRWNGSFATDKPIAAEHIATLRAYEDGEDWPEGPDDRFNPWLITTTGDGFEVRTDKPGDWKQWLQYLIDRFLKPWGYALSGAVEWIGGEGPDTGVVTVEGGRVMARRKKPAKTWADIWPSEREHIAEKIADAMAEDYRRHEDAWLAAMVALGCSPATDRTVFDD